MFINRKILLGLISSFLLIGCSHRTQLSNFGYSTSLSNNVSKNEGANTCSSDKVLSSSISSIQTSEDKKILLIDGTGNESNNLYSLLSLCTKYRITISVHGRIHPLETATLEIGGMLHTPDP